MLVVFFIIVYLCFIFLYDVECLVCNNVTFYDRKKHLMGSTFGCIPSFKKKIKSLFGYPAELRYPAIHLSCSFIYMFYSHFVNVDNSVMHILEVLLFL